MSGDLGTATAQVVDVDSYRKQPDTITVTFATPNGEAVTAEIEDDGPKTGDTVEVEYSISNPKKARLKGSHGQLLGGLLYGALALVGAAGLLAPRLFGSKRW